MNTIKMNDGIAIPSIGYGTYLAPDGQTARDSVKKAIELGYRHVDTAAIYKNEKSVGEGIKDSGVDRGEIFLTSKVWNSERGYDSTLRAFEKTISDLGTDYLDLYLIHWPANAKQFANNDQINIDTWRALEHLKEQGAVKSIGLSNFMINHLEPLLSQVKGKVAKELNQSLNKISMLIHSHYDNFK